jgi:thiol:disulfide interchange protein
MYGLVSILLLVLFIWVLVDILRARRDTMWKLIWVLVCLVLPVIGPILYYFLGRQSAPPSNTHLPR